MDPVKYWYFMLFYDEVTTSDHAEKLQNMLTDFVSHLSGFAKGGRYRDDGKNGRGQ